MIVYCIMMIIFVYRGQVLYKLASSIYSIQVYKIQYSKPIWKWFMALCYFSTEYSYLFTAFNSFSVLPHLISPIRTFFDQQSRCFEGADNSTFQPGLSYFSRTYSQRNVRQFPNGTSHTQLFFSFVKPAKEFEHE